MHYGASLGSCAGLSTSLPAAGTALPALNYLRFQTNLNLGTGPFILSCVGITHDPPASCWDTTNGAGALDRNPFYFNSNWAADAAVNISPPALYNPTYAHVVQLYNPTALGIKCGPQPLNPPTAYTLTIAPGTWANCQLMAPWALGGAVGSIKVYDSTGAIVRKLKLQHNIVNGLYSARTTDGVNGIPTSQATVNGGAACAIFTIGVCFPLASGTYEIVIQVKYSFHGVLVTWYQIDGFTVP